MRKFFAAILALSILIVPARAQAGPSVSLSWGASTTTGATYQVFRETTAGACAISTTATGCTLLTTTAISGLSYTDTNPPLAKIFYVVRALSNLLPSPLSNEVSADLTQTTVAPGTLTCSVTLSGTVLTGIVCK